MEKIFENIKFEHMLLICAPSNECIVYRKKIQNAMNDFDILSVRHDEFVNELIMSIKNKTMKKFNEKYTTCKILVLDDMDFLTNKETTQKEVYNIIKARIDNNLKTITLSNVSSNKLSECLTEYLYGLLTIDVVFDAFKFAIAPPYKGELPYIFISYAHKNMHKVFEILDKLQKRKYRIWYDEGIDPGTEWDEFIAENIEKSDYFIAFISREYLESQNCKDEINYARDLNKKRLLVYLDDIELPKGMAMRLNRLQSIHQYAYPSIEEFVLKLESTPSLSEFRDVL